jgi:hypothetical protein
MRCSMMQDRCGGGARGEVPSTRVLIGKCRHHDEGASMSTNSVPIVWRSLKLNVRNPLARFKTRVCYQCSQPVRAWHRRIWVSKRDRCAHLQCWNGLLFVNGYARLMAEDIRRSRRTNQSSNNNHANPELRELRESAQALRGRAERLEAELQHAEELAARIDTDRW